MLFLIIKMYPKHGYREWIAFVVTRCIFSISSQVVGHLVYIFSFPSRLWRCYPFASARLHLSVIPPPAHCWLIVEHRGETRCWQTTDAHYLFIQFQWVIFTITRYSLVFSSVLFLEHRQWWSELLLYRCKCVMDGCSGNKPTPELYL